MRYMCPISELICKRICNSFEEWESFYFNTARQKKKDGAKITREYIRDLGQRLYVKLSEVVQSELESIEEEECIDYAYNLVLNRTYEGYKSEIDTVYGQLESIIGVKINPAPDEWDRAYHVDFSIQVNDKYIGLQIKPISSGQALNQYQWIKMHEVSHEKFRKKFGGQVFFIYSVKAGKNKKIYNVEVIEEIKKEIGKLQK
ncbi:MAG: MjaI family restriction endonuclease [Nitrospirae bacterium]|nr:MjaI family restriction endonuclease [Nitrospirota bacterium]